MKSWEWRGGGGGSQTQTLLLTMLLVYCFEACNITFKLFLMTICIYSLNHKWDWELDCSWLSCADSREVSCFLWSRQQREMEMRPFYPMLGGYQFLHDKGLLRSEEKNKFICRFWTGCHLGCKSLLSVLLDVCYLLLLFSDFLLDLCCFCFMLLQPAKEFFSAWQYSHHQPRTASRTLGKNMNKTSVCIFISSSPLRNYSDLSWFHQITTLNKSR